MVQVVVGRVRRPIREQRLEIGRRSQCDDSTQRERLFYEPGLRISLGLVFNIDELWRKR